MPEIEEMDDDLTPTETAKGKASKRAPVIPSKPMTAAELPEEPLDVKSKDPAVIAQPVVVETKVWIVQNQITCLWSGRTIKLRPGSEVSDGSYGTGCYERFVAQGVKLIPKQ